MALTDDGHIHMWGTYLYGENNIPEGVQGNVKQITAGRSHFTVLLNDGTVRSWGQNNTVSRMLQNSQTSFRFIRITSRTTLLIATEKFIHGA